MRASSLFGFLFAVTLSVRAFAAADWNQSLKESNCPTELKALLETYKPTNNWIQNISSNTTEVAFRSETSEFAHWVEVRLAKKQPPTVIFLTPSKTDLVKFDAKCKTTTQTTKVELPKAKSKSVTYFTDEDLKKLVDSKKPGMIYLWSPGMVYSVQHYGRFQKVAKALKMEFTAVVDPMIEQQHIDKVRSKYRTGYENRKLASLDLQMRNATTHYPTVVVYDKGKISPLRIVGVMEELELQSKLSQSLSSVK